MLSASEAALLALSLPGAVEKDHFGSRSFRVGGKIFAQVGTDPDRALVKVAPADQRALIAANPDTFQAAASWGRYGWTYVALGRTDRRELASLLRRSFQLITEARRHSRHRPSTDRLERP